MRVTPRPAVAHMKPAPRVPLTCGHCDDGWCGCSCIDPAETAPCCRGCGLYKKDPWYIKTHGGVK